MNAKHRELLAWYTAAFLLVSLVYFVACFIGISRGELLTELVRLCTIPFWRYRTEVEIVLSVVLLPSVLIGCAVVLRIAFGRQFAHCSDLPLFLRDLMKVVAYGWVISSWFLLLAVRGQQDRMMCATILAALYPLAAVISSPALRFWAASAVGLALLQAIPGIRKESWGLAYLFIPPVVALIAGLLEPRPALPRRGRCHKCDYDLTGNVSGICPECGSPVKRDSNAGERHLY